MSKANPVRDSDEGFESADELSMAALREGSAREGDHHDLVMSIPVEVQIVLGSAEMPVSELMALKRGSTVSLDRRIGEPVDIVVNGRRIATGEIIILEHDPSRFGVRLTGIGETAK